MTRNRCRKSAFKGADGYPSIRYVPGPAPSGPGRFPKRSRKVVHMLRARLAAAVATPVLLGAAVTCRAEAAGGGCPAAADVTVLPSPVSPWKGAPLRVMVGSEKPVRGVLSLIAPDGSVAAKSADRLGGSAPYSWFAEVAVPASGTWHATLTP